MWSHALPLAQSQLAASKPVEALCEHNDESTAVLGAARYEAGYLCQNDGCLLIWDATEHTRYTNVTENDSDRHNSTNKL